MQGDFFLNAHRSGLYKLASHFLEKIKQNDRGSLLTNSYVVSTNNMNKINYIAETLLQIINDHEYWKHKTLWGLGLPTGIHLTQKEDNQKALYSCSPAQMNATRIPMTFIKYSHKTGLTRLCSTKSMPPGKNRGHKRRKALCRLCCPIKDPELDSKWRL